MKINIEKKVIERKEKAMSLLETFQDRLPERDFENIKILIEAGEEPMAVEDLCTQLYEWKCKCSEEELRKVEDVAEEFSVARDFVVWVAKLVC